MPRLIYVPVSTAVNCILNTLHPHVMFNPSLQSTKRLLENVHMYSEPFADRGGYQLFSRSKPESKTKCLVVPGVGIKKTQNRIILDPIELCQRYKMLGIKYGLTLDFPLSVGADDKEFFNKLEKSFYWAKLMFDWKSRENLETKLFTAIHYSSKWQLYRYFNEMSALNPDGFALPMRGWDFSLNGTIEFAYVLSFFQHKKVRRVHLLGNSTREAIIIAAASIGLRMFKQISFDSTTWNQFVYTKQPKYIDPKTMGMYPVGDNDNLQLTLPRQLRDRIINNEIDLYSSNGKQNLMVHNAYAISMYAKKMLKKARSTSDFKNYICRAKHLYHKRDNLISAIKVLERNAHNGYEFIDQWLDWLWI
jgi:hypothetical protein